MKHTRWIAVSLVLGALTGCGQQSVQEAKIEANKRWLHTRAQMQYGVAAEHLKVGQLDKARLKAMEALSLDENYTDARLLLGKVLIEQGQYGLARTELLKVCAAAPKSAEGAYVLGVAQEKEGRLEEALASYRRAYALDSTHVGAILAAAEVLVALGRTHEAHLHVESYLSAAPEDPGMSEIAGRLAMFRKDYPKAVVYFQQACDQEPKNLFYRDALATAQFMAGRYREAAEGLQRLLDQKDCKPTALRYGMLGQCHLAMNKAKEARDAFASQAELSPNDPRAHVNLAKAALKLGDYGRCLLAARAAADLDKTNLEAACLMGYALLCQDQPRKAAESLTDSARQAPPSATLQCLLGRAHAAAGSQGQARQCYQAALRLEPGNVLAKEMLASGADPKAGMLSPAP